MFEKMSRALAEIGNRIEVNVPLEGDSEGYLDKECPAETCRFGFKVHGDDWNARVRPEAVHCPMCRHQAPKGEWHTQAQVEAATRYAFSYAKGRMQRALRGEMGPSSSPLLPVSASEPMRLRASCEACGCRYSYIGSAFFCPACGHNSAVATFARSMENARRAASIRGQLAGVLDADDAENAARLLREKAMADIVMSMQRLAERVWDDLPEPKPTPRRNVFQRLDDAGALWLGATGAGFDSILPVADLARMRLYYQRRHLLAHCEGMVDADYLTRSGDAAFTLGQRITVDKASLLDFASLAERLGSGIARFLKAPPAAVATAAPPHVAVVAMPPVVKRPRNRAGLSSDAEMVAKMFVEGSREGRLMDPQVQPDALSKATGMSDEDLVEAVDELERAGLVTLHHSLGESRLGFRVATPTQSMFEVFDPVFGIGDPLADAKAIGQLLLDVERGAGADSLAERLTWPPRRLNPAMSVLACRDLAYGSQAMHQTWAHAWLRARPGLRRFVQGRDAG